ncbi:MAG: hypothetical protein AAB966_02560 [Patescibacteria group bacterium]
MKERRSRAPSLYQQFLDEIFKNPNAIVERSSKLYDVKDPHHSIPRLGRLIITHKKIPVVYLSHQSHADALVVGRITDKLRRASRMNGQDNLRGLYLPMASSVVTGDQSPEVADLYRLFTPVLEEKGLYLKSVIREQDRKRYDHQGQSHQAMKELLEAPNQGFGIAIFPEGTVEGGRTTLDEVNGLQPIQENTLMHRFIRKYPDRVVLLPVAIDGGYKIVDPNTYRPTEEAMRQVLEGDSSQIQPIATATIGDLVSVSERNIEECTDSTFLMGRLAELLPS